MARVIYIIAQDVASEIDRGEAYQKGYTDGRHGKNPKPPKNAELRELYRQGYEEGEKDLGVEKERGY